MKNTIGNYSTRDTLKNLQLVEGYSFALKKDIHAAGIKKGDFDEGDLIEIIKIELKEEHDHRTHEVKFRVTNKKGKTKDYEMSGGVFLKNFVEQLNPEDIAYKKIEIASNEIKTQVEEITKEPENEKPKKWHEKLKDKFKGKKHKK
ncbi:MAG: hypothetical protein PHH98_02210 [Candidatus Gracilibacteria bacterium]|nr:hypothetical protein [Candidatus Gracilibacteria bacterium]